MAAFSKSRGIFGAPISAEILAPSTAQTAPMPNMGVLAPTTHPELQPAVKQPSVGMQLLGSMGGMLSQWAGGENFYAKQMSERQRAAQDAAQYQQQRADKFTDWRAQHDYEVKNPKPSTAQPYRWEDNAGNLRELGPDGQPRLVFGDPVARYVPDGVGGMVPVPGTGAAGATPVAPVAGAKTAPRGRLTPLSGGAASQGAGGFPLR